MRPGAIAKVGRGRPLISARIAEGSAQMQRPADANDAIRAKIDGGSDVVHIDSEGVDAEGALGVGDFDGEVETAVVGVGFVERESLVGIEWQRLRARAIAVINGGGPGVA